MNDFGIREYSGMIQDMPDNDSPRILGRGYYVPNTNYPNLKQQKKRQPSFQKKKQPTNPPS
jgi:hypothetical protein